MRFPEFKVMLPDQRSPTFYRGPQNEAVIDDLVYEPDFPPHLIIHSRDDTVVPISQSELLTAQLDQSQVPYQVYYFDEASHYLLSPGGESREIYDLVINFLAEQYEQVTIE